MPIRTLRITITAFLVSTMASLVSSSINALPVVSQV